jgi:hypothetical protein
VVAANATHLTKFVLRFEYWHKAGRLIVVDDVPKARYTFITVSPPGQRFFGDVQPSKMLFEKFFYSCAATHFLEAGDPHFLQEIGGLSKKKAPSC